MGYSANYGKPKVRAPKPKTNKPKQVAQKAAPKKRMGKAEWLKICGSSFGTALNRKVVLIKMRKAV